MKKLVWAGMLVAAAMAGAQGNPPPYLLYTLVAGVPTAATGSGTPLGYNPPPMLCYGLNGSGQAAPCVFSGGGSMTWPTYTGLTAYGGSNNWVTPTSAMVITTLGYTPTNDAQLAPTVTYYVDGNRTDTYTATGSIDKPFKTLDATFAAMNASSAAAFTLQIAPATYTPSGSLSAPAVPVVVNGNDAFVSLGAHVLTFNGFFSITDLDVSGALIFMYTGAEQSHYNGGNLTGSLAISGNEQFIGVAFTNEAIDVTATAGLPYFNFIQATGTNFTTHGSAVYLNKSVVTNSTASPIVDSTTNGGSVYATSNSFTNGGGAILACNGGGQNILQDLILSGGTAPDCGATSTSWAKLTVPPLGTALSGLADVDSTLLVTGLATFGANGTATQIGTTSTPIASLPAASTLPPVTTGSNVQYTYMYVNDGLTGADCTAGAGSILHWCYSNGTAWVSAVPPTAGTVTTVSVVTANGVSGTVASATTTPAITLALGAITPSSVVATGVVDGHAPAVGTTQTACTLGTASSGCGGSYSGGFSINQYATAGTGVTYTLPVAAAGHTYCITNGYNGSAANTGALTLQTSGSGQYIVFTDGTLSASGGYVVSNGAARDSACVVADDTTHWILYTQSGTWNKH